MVCAALRLLVVAALLVAVSRVEACETTSVLRVEPAAVLLRGPHDIHSILVDGIETSSPANPPRDLTREATFESSDERVVRVDPQG
ncbi:MAG TPA: hypothetical protein VGE52_09915, partial [Pirellulales bacterium]